MPSNNPEALNVSGLTPDESKNLKERQAEPYEEKIIQCMKEVRSRDVDCRQQLLRGPYQLYSCKLTEVT